MAPNRQTDKGGGGRPPVNGRNAKPITGGSGGGGGVNLTPIDRHVTYYKLTSSDIILLGSLSFLSTLFCSAGSAFLSYYFNLQASLALATQPLSGKAQFLDETIAPATWYVGVFLFAIGLLSGIIGMFRFNSIRKEHTTKDEK
jgi:hypothetical protein